MFLVSSDFGGVIELSLCMIFWNFAIFHGSFCLDAIAAVGADRLASSFS
jgi:hypothetical protein